MRPRCRRKLQVISLPTQPAIELDRCPLGHGLWFDKGEMETLIAGCPQGEAGAVREHFAELFTHEIQTKSKGE